MREVIRYAWGESSIGDFVIAFSEKGLVSFEFASKRLAMEDALRLRFPDAKLVHTSGLADDLAKIERLVDHPVFDPGIELDMRGTPYEIQVWQMLKAIPMGQTTNYGALAAQLGTKDARDVTAAIAANPIAVLVPCHRVIKKDGSISGYRWGGQHKEQLLEREAAKLSMQDPAFGLPPRSVG